MEIQKINGNCSLYSLKGNDNKLNYSGKEIFKKDLKETTSSIYFERNNTARVMLVTNLTNFNWVDRLLKNESYCNYKFLKKLGFKNMGKYKKNARIMIAKVYNIQSS